MRFGKEFLVLIVNGDGWFTTLLLNFERPMFQVTLHILVVHLAANKTFCVEYRVFWFEMKSIFGTVTDT